VSDSPDTKLDLSPAEKLRSFLASKGQRLTNERRAVVDEIFSSHEHFDAEQLVSRLAPRTDDRRVSRSSVYRAIALLEEAGLIRKVARANDRDVYEHDYGYPKHDHLLCQQCGALTEFPNERISELLEGIANEHGFRASGHRLVVYGTCADCRESTD
jgi:Fur family transcriptional regulator, ferric uptake regulator